MPNTKAAAKYLRQSTKRRAHNDAIKMSIRRLLKNSRRQITDKKTDEARKTVADLIKILDKAAAKRVITKNTAARHKSRLAKRLKTLS